MVWKKVCVWGGDTQIVKTLHFPVLNVMFFNILRVIVDQFTSRAFCVYFYCAILRFTCGVYISKHVLENPPPPTPTTPAPFF